MKEVLKIGAITIVKEAKKIHQNNIMLVKIGGFYRTYGRDAYIFSNLFGYKTKQENKYKCQYINVQKMENKNVQKLKLCRLSRFVF